MPVPFTLLPRLLRSLAVPAAAAALLAASCGQAGAASPDDGARPAGLAGGPLSISCQTRAETPFGEQVCYSSQPVRRVDVTAALQGTSFGRCTLAEVASRCELTGAVGGYTADVVYEADFTGPAVTSTARICVPDGSCTTETHVYRF